MNGWKNPIRMQSDIHVHVRFILSKNRHKLHTHKRNMKITQGYTVMYTGSYVSVNYNIEQSLRIF